MNGAVNEINKESEKLIEEIYRESWQCAFDPESNTLISVKLVKSTDQCQIHTLFMRFRQMTKILNLKIIYSSFVIASLGLIGNTFALSVYGSREYQKKQHISVYMLVKTAFEQLEYINLILFLDSIKKVDIDARSNDGNYNGNYDTTLRYVIPIAFQLSVIGRSWTSAILSIERFLAVWAPFWTRLHLGRPLAIKLSFAIITASIIFTTIDFLLSEFNVQIGNIEINGMFIGGGYKLAIFGLIFSFLLPWLIVLFCTILTSIGMRLSRNKRLAMIRSQINQARGQSSMQHNSRDSILVRMVVLSLVSFLISSVPFVGEATIHIIGSSIESLLVSYKTIEIIGIVEIYFLLISYGLDFYFALFTRSEFRAQLKKYAVSIKNIFSTCE